MAQTAFVRARVDEKVKDEAAAVLAHFGLTVSDVVRMTLNRVAEDRAVPFELKIPNAETRAAMAEADEIIRTKRARFKNAKELFDDLDRKGRRR
jgi:DNA-damage-inducible protein J